MKMKCIKNILDVIGSKNLLKGYKGCFKWKIRNICDIIQCNAFSSFLKALSQSVTPYAPASISFNFVVST